MKSLQGKTTVVTGGAKGIGSAIVQLFADEGASVISVDLSTPEKQRKNVEDICLDITDSAACTEFCTDIVNRYAIINVLVNNAGITMDGMTRKMTDEQWQRVLNVNLSGAFYLTRCLGPHMQEQRNGSIINISSVVGIFGNIGQANYATSKAGIIGLTKSWAKEFALKGGNVRVNAIAPGYTMTDMMKTVPDELLAQFEKQTMLGRLGQPHEIAQAALFLASDQSSYITGQVLGVDGGMRL
ncbi:MAG: 3-oxoacyl-ACP reductase FabG [Christensenella sp.]|uniref:SDR family NAD(P)-dependent oxidoreductase n=1 Tax=Christensenella sp. TaxID=1935934 RepID=UPI002B1EBA25|nr:3-oxoacyl-ACP reductase FabG [Christensenella sp.]MEA5002206.1 3-oxoacyl-ACP reductase FabG [Christensenella sp.]